MSKLSRAALLLSALLAPVLGGAGKAMAQSQFMIAPDNRYVQGVVPVSPAGQPTGIAANPSVVTIINKAGNGGAGCQVGQLETTGTNAGGVCALAVSGGTGGGGGGGGPTLSLGLATTAAPSYGNNTQQDLSLDTAGNLRVSVLGAILPPGAATAANQAPPTAAGTSAGSAAPVQGVTSGVPVATRAPAGTGAAPSGATTISTVGTYQTLFSAASIVNGAAIQNPSSNTVALTVDLAGATGSSRASTSLDLQPGQTLQLPFVPANAITVTASSAISFSAVRY